jgi:hypothetical protein
MKPNISVQQSALRLALTERGWEVAAVESPGDWWCHERWRLRSLWPPRNREAFITFLVEPQSELTPVEGGERRVWAAAASAAPLATWQDAPSQGTLKLAQRWESQVPLLMEYLAKLRSSSRAR